MQTGQGAAGGAPPDLPDSPEEAAWRLVRPAPLPSALGPQGTTEAAGTGGPGAPIHVDGD